MGCHGGQHMSGTVERPFYIKRALQSGGEKAADRIEALAQANEPADD